jgi:hypothetical protein
MPVLAATEPAVLGSPLQVAGEQLGESFACTNDVPVKTVNDILLINNTGAHFHHCNLRREETLTTTIFCAEQLMPGTRTHFESALETASC